MGMDKKAPLVRVKTNKREYVTTGGSEIPWLPGEKVVLIEPADPEDGK